MVTVKSGTPILPATVKTGGTIPVAVKQMSSHSNVVKIALPPTQQQQLVRTSSAPAGVNFINILRNTFSYKSVWLSFSLVTSRLCNFSAQEYRLKS